MVCRTDPIAARVLAALSERHLVPEICLPDRQVRSEREQARFPLHTWSSTNRCSRTHPFHADDRASLPGLRPVRSGRPRAFGEFPDSQPWRETVDVSPYLIDHLESEIAASGRQPRASGAEHRDVTLLLTVSGIGRELASAVDRFYSEAVERLARGAAVPALRRLRPIPTTRSEVAASARRS